MSRQSEKGIHKESGRARIEERNKCERRVVVVVDADAGSMRGTRETDTTCIVDRATGKGFSLAVRQSHATEAEAIDGSSRPGNNGSPLIRSPKQVSACRKAKMESGSSDHERGDDRDGAGCVDTEQ